MKRSLTEYTKDQEREQSIRDLNAVYALLPQTRCTASDCRKECCTKSANLVTKGGKFMSLPLIYSVEYWNIDNYILDSIPEYRHAEIYATKRESRLCVFFDEKTLTCGIYPARPLSCRLFGLRLPNRLWGVDFEPDAMGSVHCRDLEVLDTPAYEVFIREYDRIWDSMAALSSANPVTTSKQDEIIKQSTGLESLYLLGWIQFNFLRFSSLKSLREKIDGFWKDYKRSL